MELNNLGEKEIFIISEDEFTFRSRVIELYKEIYKDCLPTTLVFSKYNDLKNFVLNCEKKIDFFSLSILKDYEDLIQIFDDVFDTLSKDEKKQLRIKTWPKATLCNTLTPMKTLKYFKIEFPYDLLLYYARCYDHNENCFNMDVLKFLVEDLKVTVNLSYVDSKDTAILIFSGKCNEEAVIYLHKQGASILCKDEDSKNCIDKLFEFIKRNSMDNEKNKKANNLFNYLYTNGCPFNTQFGSVFKYKQMQ